MHLHSVNVTTSHVGLHRFRLESPSTLPEKTGRSTGGKNIDLYGLPNIWARRHQLGQDRVQLEERRRSGNAAYRQSSTCCLNSGGGSIETAKSCNVFPSRLFLDQSMLILEESALFPRRESAMLRPGVRLQLRVATFNWVRGHIGTENGSSERRCPANWRRGDGQGCTWCRSLNWLTGHLEL